MTIERALELLRTAPRDAKPSRVNPSLSRKQAVEIVEASLLSDAAQGIDPFSDARGHLTEKRVWQVVLDRKKPRYLEEHKYEPPYWKR